MTSLVQSAPKGVLFLKIMEGLKSRRLASVSRIKNRKVVAGVGVIIVLVLIFIVRPKGNAIQNETSNQTQDLQSTVRAAQTINKEYEFPLKNSKGAEVSKFKYTVEKVEITDSLRSKDGKVNPGAGKTFLVVTLKITNPYEKTIQINTKDYIRLSKDNNQDELLAPDLHNDPVEIQAISTKSVKIAFYVLKTSKDFVLQVGEITEDKDKIELEIVAE